MPNRERTGPFNLDPLGANLPRPLGAMVRLPLQALLGFPQLNQLYEAVESDGSLGDFSRAVLEYCDLSAQIRFEDLDRAPREGPMVMVANHPFGGVDALILAWLIQSLRSDYKVLANYVMAVIPELRKDCIFVDPFETKQARRANVKPMKEALNWLKAGHALGVFPSGEVSHYEPAKRQVVDPEWNETVGGLVRRTQATVVPIYFEGSNGPMFQFAGLIHPRLRTALLPRQLLNKQHKTITVQIGTPITPQELAWCDSDRQCIDYLRLRTNALAGRSGPLARGLRRRADKPKPRPGRRKGPAAVAAGVDGGRLAKDVLALPEDARLAANGDLVVYHATADQMPNLLPELGRLREITFREVGEGSGKSLDLDEFDHWYVHLLVWNHAQHELVGSYRLGPSDTILPRHGVRGLYVSSLFDIQRTLFDQLGHSIELGRSFVRPEYQHSLAPMMLLWKGIGQFVAARQHYRHLIGPVSISNSYRPLSRALIVAFLSQPERVSEFAHLVRPRTPFDVRKAANADVLALMKQVRDLDELNRLVADVEPDGKGVPSLMRNYLKLGAKSLAFNVDPDFGFCLDSLCVFDGLCCDRRTMRRYMGEQHISTYRTIHGDTVTPGDSP